MDLPTYERCKFQLADVLREAAALRTPQGGVDTEASDLLQKLAGDRFNIAVVGQFSRGKSSLMNAILGGPWLPTGLAPRTSVVTAVRYAETPSARIYFEGRMFDQPIGLEALAEYVTEEHNPGNVRKVKLAEVGLPVDLLRRGVHLIDTPGVGSAIAENTATTNDFIPKADAFLLVTSFHSPLSQEEVDILTRARDMDGRVFVVINKKDVVTPAQEAEALVFVGRQLQRLFGIDTPPIFTVSAVTALAAKTGRDAMALEASGVAALERALLTFILGEKGRQLLMRLAQRSKALLQTLPPDNAVPLLDRLAEVLEECGQPLVANAPSPVIGRTQACEICCAMVNAAFDFLRGFGYRLIVQAEARLHLAQSGGFCESHSWQYKKLASPQGMAAAYPDVLEAWAQRLLALRAESLQSASDLLSEAEQHAADACPACLACAHAESTAIASAAKRIRETGSFEGLSAICLAHTTSLCRAIDHDRLASQFLERQAMLCEQLADDMRRYSLKFDGARRAWASQQEEHASEDALELIAGLSNARSGRSPRFHGRLAHLTDRRET